jgi:diguanylate cyclase (GGDEF)-like protein/PAS domain S-box-containing protein
VNDEEDRTDVSPDAALDRVLVASADALVAGLAPGTRLLPVPPSVRLRGQRQLERHSALDLVAPDDVGAIIDAWRRAQDETVVTLHVRLLVQPDVPAVLHMVDLRRDHGVHVMVLEVEDPSELLEAAEALEIRRRRVGHVRRDELAAFLDVDAAASSILGWSAAELVGRRTVDFVHPDDVNRAVESWMAMRTGTGVVRSQVRFRRPDDRYVWVEVSHENHLDDPSMGCVLSELVDISAQMADLQALHERERHLHRLAEALPIGICHLRTDRQVVYCNAPLIRLFGPVDSVDALLAGVDPADRPLVERAIEQALAGTPGGLEAGVRQGPHQRRCDLTMRTMLDDEGQTDGVIVCAADVTERSRLRHELEHRATHDALTGCLDRAALMADLEVILAVPKGVSVAFIDVDHLKATNDRLGHAAGDAVLRVVAERLRQVTRAEDRVGRIGGDEFAVLCPVATDAIDAIGLADRLTAAICRDFTYAGHRLPVRVSIGVAVSSGPGGDEAGGPHDAEALLSRADAAMYLEKRRNRAGGEAANAATGSSASTSSSDRTSTATSVRTGPPARSPLRSR